MGWQGVSFGLWVPLCGIAAAEKTLDSKPGWSVTCWGNKVYVTDWPRSMNGNSDCDEKVSAPQSWGWLALGRPGWGFRQVGLNMSWA